MLHPLLWIGGLLGGAVLVAYGGGALQATDPMALPLVAAGGGLVLLSLAMLVLSWRASRRRAYAAAVVSPEAVARWQVFPRDMEVFRRIDAARAGRLWSLSNALTFPSSVPMEGFPVIVGESSLVVADRLYELGIRHFGTPGEIRLHPGEPGFLEIHNFLPGETRKTHIAVLRIPVPAAALNAAETAYRHLDASIMAHDRNHIHRWFAAHFQAAAQSDDSPHRLQRRRKWLIPALALFFAAMLAIIVVPRLI